MKIQYLFSEYNILTLSNTNILVPTPKDKRENYKKFKIIKDIPKIGIKAKIYTIITVENQLLR